MSGIYNRTCYIDSFTSTVSYCSYESFLSNFSVIIRYYNWLSRICDLRTWW